MADLLLPDVSCVLYDMDGVLVDVSQSYRVAIARTAEKFIGRPVHPDTIQAIKDRGGFNDDWALTHEIIREDGVEIALDTVVAEFQRLYQGDDWNGLITRERSLIDSDTLVHLVDNGIRVGIVTGRPRAEAQWTIERHHWDDIMDVVVAREDQADRPKPDAYPLQVALDRLGFQTVDRSVYVGDSVDDMVTAVRAGATPIGFLPPYLPSSHARTLQDHGARLVITDHAELLSVVNAE